METKEQLINTVKDWVKNDNEIKVLQKELTQRKNEKKKISKELIEVMRKNEIDCLDINNGQIVYSKKSIKKPITKKTLMGILSNFYKGDIDQAAELNTFILENREDVVKESIIRKMTKA